MRLTILIILLMVPLSGCLGGQSSSTTEDPIIIEGPIDCTHPAISCIEATATGDKISIDLVSREYVPRPGVEIRELDRPLEIDSFLIDGFAVGISVLCDDCALTLSSGTVRVPDEANVEGITWDGGSYLIAPNATFDERAVEGIHGVEVLGHRTKLRLYEMSFDLPGGGGWFKLSPGSLLATRIGGSSALYVENFDNQVRIDGLEAKARVRSAMPGVWFGLFGGPETGGVIIRNALIEGFDKGIDVNRVSTDIRSTEVNCERDGMTIKGKKSITMVNITVTGCERQGLRISSSDETTKFRLELLNLIRNREGLLLEYSTSVGITDAPRYGRPTLRDSVFLENTHLGINSTGDIGSDYYIENTLFCRNGIGYEPENPNHDPNEFGAIVTKAWILPSQSSFIGNVPWGFADISDNPTRAIELHGNWWGSPNGPYVVSKNSTSSPLPRDMFGDAIRANAPVYTPFETEPLHTGC